MSSARRDRWLTIAVLLAMVLAVAVGAGLRAVPGGAEWVGLVSWLGVLFKQLLLMLIYPLVFVTMVLGVASLGDIRKVGGIASTSVAYFMTTTAIAVAIGMVLVNVIRPGEGASLMTLEATDVAVAEVGVGEFFVDLLRNTFKNPFASAANGDVLALLAFGLVLGAALTTVGDRGKAALDAFGGINDALFRLVDWVMYLAPIGVFALLLDIVVAQGLGVLIQLRDYVFTVVLALGIHGLIVLPLIAAVVGRVSPRRFFRAWTRPASVAFSTASSAATMPVTLQTVQEDLGVSKRTSSFVVPLGTTVNMDGTALYEAVAAIFIAQLYPEIDLTFGQQLIVFATAVTAAVGAAGIPGAGLVTMGIVLVAVGLPLEAVGLIYAVDRLLDMCRTAVNVTGDMVGCLVVDRIRGGDMDGVPTEAG